MTDLSMIGLRPVWVVSLFIDKKGQQPARSDIKYVRAATQAGAVRCAKANSLLPLKCRAAARIATPQDLGCVPTVRLPEYVEESQ